MAAGPQSIDLSPIERSEIRLAIRAVLADCGLEARDALASAYRKLATVDGFAEHPRCPDTFVPLGDAAVRVVERAARMVSEAASVVDDEARHLATAAASLDSKISSLTTEERSALR